MIRCHTPTAVRQLLSSFLILFFSLSAAAQTHFTLGGTEYELVEWPAVSASSTNSTTSSADYGAIQIDVAGNSIVSSPGTIGDFYNVAVYATPGYGITGVPSFLVNNGQESSGGDTTTTYSFSGATLPTELLFYAGGDTLAGISGMKYVRWAWSSTQPGTQFEVVSHTGTTGIPPTTGTFDITGSGTSTLSWRTYGADNNTAMALVRVTNPAGISDFSIVSNRLSITGADNVYSLPAQRADYVGTAILIAKRPSATSAVVVPVPTLNPTALALLFGLVAMTAWLIQRRSGAF
ncbi:hypothetical protein [Ottowia sp.]|uniref:hypothetical protein n=1 Tax=Ottowia sp. TaxID=1898956 RepID=UPI003A87D1F2